MELTRVDAVESPSRRGYLRLLGRVEYEDTPGAVEEYWFEVPEDSVDGSGSGDPWLAALLPAAVAREEPLRIGAPVDPLLASNAVRLMRIWSCWYPELSPVPLEAEARGTGAAEEARATPVTRGAGGPVRGGSAGSRIGAFFSGGVDSLFTAVRPRDLDVAAEGPPPDDLVTVWGFDIPLSDSEAFARLRTRLAAAAGELDKGFVEVATNLRETRWRETPWGPLGHGAALAAVGLCLGRYETLHVPATGGFRDLHPWGSHPLTDPLYSTCSTAFRHDGAAFTRTEKLRFLAGSSVALRTLRVCWESGSDRNCGRCMKCTRAALTLELLGALDRCPTLPDAVDLGRVGRLRCEHSWDFRELSDIRRLALERGRSDVARAVGRAVRRSTWRWRIRDLRRVPGRRRGRGAGGTEPWRRWES